MNMMNKAKFADYKVYFENNVRVMSEYNSKRQLLRRKYSYGLECWYEYDEDGNMIRWGNSNGEDRLVLPS